MRIYFIIIVKLILLIVRLITVILGLWPLVVIAAMLWFFDTTPHVRWTANYHMHVNGSPVFTGCTYLGVHGLITPLYVEGCPVIKMINTNNRGR